MANTAVGHLWALGLAQMDGAVHEAFLRLRTPSPEMIAAMLPILIHADPEQDPEDILQEAWTAGMDVVLKGAPE